jgi:chromosomal replication initiation ATPase DnaA
MKEGAGQLPLPFADQAVHDAVDFVASPSNQAALTWLARDEWPDRRLALWGPAGCGKTHLLHAWSHRRGATWLSGRTLCDLTAVPRTGCLALDDADHVPDAELLLHLLNTARDRGLTVLMASRPAPARWPVTLPDLTSRLRAICAVEIANPDDDLLDMLLGLALSLRQLDVPLTARTWLLRHLPRTASGILEAVRRLDAESLMQHKPITRSFVARVLGAEPHDDVSMADLSEGEDHSHRSPDGS